MGVILETAIVLAATILTIAATRWAGLTAWWMTPTILTTAGMVPYLVRRQSPPALLRPERLGQDLWITAYTSLAILPATYVAMWLLTRAGVHLPLQAVRPPSYATWAMYLFLYVAPAEEMFFRGYLMANMQAVFAQSPHGLKPILRIKDWVPIALSAACFALAHLAIQGQASALLTFLPGLVMGWLFSRTGTLLAPILFHGLANMVWQSAGGW
jgi:membrane protease YdiL (CAAX protease family)